MLEASALDEIIDIINESDFYSPTHQRLFSAIKELSRKDSPTDIVTISNYLLERKELELAGGMPYLVELADTIPSTANIVSYANIVREKSVLRRVIQMSSGFIDKAYKMEFEDISGFLDHIEQDVFNIAEARNATGLMDVNELIKQSITKLEDLYARQLSVTGVPSGFTALDNMTAGFQPGELIVIAARPSMGKTAFSLNVALNAALREGKKVAYFSVEMSSVQVMLRLLAGAAKVNMSDLRVGHLNERAWGRIISSAGQISETGLYIDDSAAISPFEIRSKARRLKAKHGLDLIMIDYLQMMSMKQKVESREREVSEISRLLKAIAKELKVPVVALAQLNRAVEGRSDRRPMLSDLRESGSIEQDSDVIMMLYREDYYDRENPEIKGLAEVIVAKQRNGPTDTIKLKWVPEFGLFENIVQGAEAPLPSDPPSSGRPQNNNSQGGAQHRNRRPPNLAPGNA